MNPQPQPTPVLQARALGLVYENEEKAALAGIDLQVEAGEVVGVLGKSGAGKTSLLRTLGGMIAPTSGQVEVFGQALVPGKIPAGLRASLVESNVIDPRQRLREIFLRPGRDEMDLLQVLGLYTELNRPLDILPQTLRNRASLALAFSPATTGPGIFLIDELPGLDLETAALLQGWLPDWAHGLDQAVLLASRYPAVLYPLCDRILVLHAGRLVDDVSTRELGSPANGKVDQYRLRLRGRLDPGRAAWFPGLRLTLENESTLLEGEIADQSALHGLLARIRDMGLPLERLERLEPSIEYRLGQRM
ncbi:MAG TPA: ATP-binding cassette domain-containing protein [Anaerolineaceae bacterium]|nr:ATP-binding cassette domain-containing protein [Anaerolineaceae bacterium]